MAVDTDYSLAMSSGIASVAPADTVATTGMAALTTPWVDLGGMSTDGLSESLKQTRQDFKRWGSIAIFKSVITDESHTFKVTFLESNANVLSLFYRTGTAPIPDATTHIISITDDTTGTRDVRAMTFDLLDGTNHARFYCPRIEVTDVDDPVYVTDKLTQYGVTLTAYPNTSGVAISRQFLLNAVVG